MLVIMGVPIFVHFGASHVLPHGTSGLEPHFDIYQSQFAHWCNQEQEFSKIFLKTLTLVILEILGFEGTWETQFVQAKDSIKHP